VRCVFFKLIRLCLL